MEMGFVCCLFFKHLSTSGASQRLSIFMKLFKMFLESIIVVERTVAKPTLMPFLLMVSLVATQHLSRRIPLGTVDTLVGFG